MSTDNASVWVCELKHGNKWIPLHASIGFWSDAKKFRDAEESYSKKETRLKRYVRQIR